MVEENPMFPGCEDIADKMERKKCADEKMLQFIYSNLKYPALAKENRVEGMVVVKFVIQKDGAITQAEIIRDIGAGCGHEALRIINAMPQWIPGKQLGVPIAVQYNLPVKFKLDENGEPVNGQVGNREEKVAPKPLLDLIKENPDMLKEKILTVKDQGVAIYYESSPPASHQSPDDEIFKVVEESPKFPGCEEVADEVEQKKCAESKMIQFLFENINYPAEARKKKVEGMVIIGFIVEKDGSISHTRIIRDPGGGCGEEALRVVKLMPKWNPGMHKGLLVRVEYNLPVKFSM